MVDIFGRPESTNVEDRRNALPPLLRSFEFDGKTIGLDMTGPNPHNGGMLTDQQAIGKYLSDHSYYGLPTNQQAHFSAANLDPRVIDTIIAEAGNDRAGQRAVAAAIINRANSQGKTPLQIVQQRGQFEGYSNPGKASTKAQQVASVRANAARSFNDIASGSVADPLNGGTDFRASSATGGLHAPHGTVTIGGNTFALGKAPSTGLEAIQAVAPVPMPSLPAQTSAYANLPATTPPPLPIPRPSNPAGIRSVEINPDGTPTGSLADILAGRFGNSMQGDASIYKAVPGFAPAPPPSLISRPVNTIRIDPLTNQPISDTPSLQEALNTKAAQMAQQRSILPVSGSVGVNSGISGSALPTPKFLSYNSSAGNVALPPNVVPASALRDLQIIAPRSVNSSGSPDDRQTAPVIKPASLPPVIAPTPMPSRPAALNTPQRPPDIIKSVPYVAPPQSKQPYIDASAPINIDRLALTNDPFRAPPPPVQAIQQAIAPRTAQILNPAYTAWQANPVATNKLQDIHDLRDDAMMKAQTSAAPPKYITVAVPHVPVPSSTRVPLTSFNTVNPTSQILPNVGSWFNTTPAGHIGQAIRGEPIQGGLLGMLFGSGGPFGGSPQAARSTPSAPNAAPGANFLSTQGINTQGLTIGQQANELNKALAGSSRNADGSRGFS